MWYGMLYICMCDVFVCGVCMYVWCVYHQVRQVDGGTAPALGLAPGEPQDGAIQGQPQHKDDAVGQGEVDLLVVLREIAGSSFL